MVGRHAVVLDETNYIGLVAHPGTRVDFTATYGVKSWLGDDIAANLEEFNHVSAIFLCLEVIAQD